MTSRGGDQPVQPGEESSDAVTVYWRRGCGFCASLLRGLERTALPVRRIDIWAGDDEADAARAFVRSVARGCETVPTVVVGGAARVNPSLDEVVAMVADHAPHLVAS